MKTLNKSHQRYFSALCVHGIYVMQKVMDRLSNEERYEMAAKCKDVIDEYCRIYRIDVPKPVQDIEDFKVEFWRLGMSGDIAAENFEAYQNECYQELFTKHKKR